MYMYVSNMNMIKNSHIKLLVYGSYILKPVHLSIQHEHAKENAYLFSILLKEHYF